MLFGPKGPFCQSCGMPLSKDVEHGGTNVDGSKSSEYCSKCYQHGEFTRPTMTVQEMQALVEERMIEMRFPKFVAKYFTKGIPQLRRWKSQGA